MELGLIDWIFVAVFALALWKDAKGRTLFAIVLVYLAILISQWALGAGGPEVMPAPLHNVKLWLLSGCGPGVATTATTPTPTPTTAATTATTELTR